MEKPQKRIKLLNFLYENLEQEDQKKVLQYTVRLSGFEELVKTNNEIKAEKIKVIPSKGPKEKSSRGVAVGSSYFKSFRKACDHFKVNYQVAIKKRQAGLSNEEIFKTDNSANVVVRKAKG